MNDSMMLIVNQWDGVKSFKLIPVTEECPYVEAIYDPRQKVLAVISKITKEQLHMLPKLDSNGVMVPMKNAADGKNPWKQERIVLDTFQEYYLTEEEDIHQFVKFFAKNVNIFAYKEFMTDVVSETEPVKE